MISEKRQPNLLSPHNDPLVLANQFGEYFCRTMELIKTEIDSIVVETPVVEHPQHVPKPEAFSPLLNEDVNRIIMTSSNATCQQGPVNCNINWNDKSGGGN